MTNEFRAYHWYRRGFTAGASGQRKLVPPFTPDDMEVVWRAGYVAGIGARKTALLKAMKMLQYKPFRLRGPAPKKRHPKQMPLPMYLREPVKAL